MSIENMSVFEQARWYSLIEAVNIIADECESRGHNFDKMKVSPLDLEKYIESTCDIYARKIETENETNINNAITIKFHNNQRTQKVI